MEDEELQTLVNEDEIFDMMEGVIIENADEN